MSRSGKRLTYLAVLLTIIAPLLFTGCKPGKYANQQEIVSKFSGTWEWKDPLRGSEPATAFLLSSIDLFDIKVIQKESECHADKDSIRIPAIVRVYISDRWHVDAHIDLIYMKFDLDRKAGNDLDTADGKIFAPASFPRILFSGTDTVFRDRTHYGNRISGALHTFTRHIVVIETIENTDFREVGIFSGESVGAEIYTL